MSLLQALKDASLTARKIKDPTAIFQVTLYAEAAKVGKDKRNDESTDDEVISVLKKFKAGAEIVINAATERKDAGDQALIDQALVEISIVDQYLPTMMSEDELTIEIIEFVKTLEDSTAKQMGKVMAHLKATFPGLYDGAMASKLVKNTLNG